MEFLKGEKKKKVVLKTGCKDILKRDEIRITGKEIKGNKRRERKREN